MGIGRGLDGFVGEIDDGSGLPSGESLVDDLRDLLPHQLVAGDERVAEGVDEVPVRCQHAADALLLSLEQILHSALGILVGQDLDRKSVV